MATVVVKTMAVVTAVTVMTGAFHLRANMAAVGAALLSQARRGGGY
jgi:hypothetical protein